MPEKKTPKDFWQIYAEVFRSRQRVIVGSALLALLLCIFLQQTGLVESLENRIGRPTLFYIRQQLNLAPKLDPRLVIYGYDDEALNEWGRPELLSGRQWGELIGAIVAHKPKAVLVDMVFASPRKDAQDIASMNKAFKHPVPVYTAAAALENRIRQRKPAPLTAPKYLASTSEMEFLKKYRGSNDQKFAYGPFEKFTQLQINLGQINYRNPGFFKPIIPFPPDRLLRHLGLSAAEKQDVHIDGSNLYLNNKKISLNGDGEAIVNWSSPKEYRANTFKILNLVENWRDGQLSGNIKSDSIVLFLPLMFTGNADFKDTFVGQLVGGYVQAAVINSSLTGQWVNAMDPSYLGVLLAVIAALIGGLIRRNYVMISYVVGINLWLFVTVVVLFLTNGWLVEWVNTMLAFNLAIVPVVILSEVAEEIRSIRMNDALSGVLSPKMLEQISKAPEAFKLSAVEQTVTVMFVDFVGFSLVAEQMPSRIVFESLKRHFSELSAIIHKFHGIVDKSLGDGLMGVFGFDPVTREVNDTHAEDAVLCSLEIQNFIAQRCAAYNKSDANSDAVIFASRLGLNTGTVFIGNIGDRGRLDLTVIGHTVNMGKRLEDACEPFKVLVGQSTQQYLTAKLKEQLTKRDVQIKHYKQLIHAFELDPFQANPQLYSKALAAFREFSNISRIAERLVVPPEQVWELHQSGVANGCVVDYSVNGLCVDLKNFYGNKVMISFDVIIRSKLDNKILQELRGLHATVKWGRKAEDKFRHGVVLSDESASRFRAVTDAFS